MKIYSNTSHVLIYQDTWSLISRLLEYSNTSHVLIYQSQIGNLAELMTDSNTSHVLIYHDAVVIYGGIEEFKYISCSYLSA